MLLNRGRPSIGGAAGAKARADKDAVDGAKVEEQSREKWQADLGNLLRNAEKRFADIGWLTSPGGREEIWAHKAIIYARAGGQFQLRYLSGSAPAPHSRLPLQLPSGSSLSVNNVSSHSLAQSFDIGGLSASQRAFSPGGMSLNSLAPSVRQQAVLSGTDPTLFHSILDALYTGSGLTEVFSFLFDESKAGDDAASRVAKLRRDLLYMWRSKLYADCRIMLVSADGQPPDIDDESAEDEAVFSAHRAILCSRSPYFHSLLLDPYADSQKRIFSLPSPPFTPASLHFALGYLYTGTLSFSNRTFDLSTAMQIWRSAQYLGLDQLRDEAEVRIMRMCHNFKDVCSSCVTRIGRVYCFSLAPDVESKRLQELTSKPTVEAFGEIWCKDIGELDYERQTKLVELVCTGIDPNTTVDVIRNSKRLRERIGNERTQWADHLLSMLDPIDSRVATVLRKKFPAVVTSKAFQALLEGVGFSNDVLERLLTILTDNLAEDTAAETYQVLVGQVLLRDEGIPMDARARVEDARAAIIKYLKTKWVGVKAYNGFEPLDNWALKELSDELEVSVDDLLTSNAPSLPLTRSGLRPSPAKVPKVVDDDSQGVTASSLRASVLNRNAARQSATHGHKSTSDSLASSTPRVRPTNGARAASTLASSVTPRISISSRTSVNAKDSLAKAVTPKAPAKAPPPSEAPATPSASALAEAEPSSPEAGPSSPPKPSRPPPPLPMVANGAAAPAKKSPTASLSTRSARTSTSSVRTATTPRTSTSRAGSIASVRSTAAAAARPRASAPTNPTPAAAGSRPRAPTGASTSSAAAARLTTSSPAVKKAAAPLRSATVKKAASTLSVRSTASASTVGQRKRNPATATDTSSIPVPEPPGSDQTTRGTKSNAAPKAPARLRTTSATARTTSSTRQLAKADRPGSVNSVRSTGTTASASNLATPRATVKGRRPKVVPPLPNPPSAETSPARARTVSKASSVTPQRAPLVRRHLALDPPSIVEPDSATPKRPNGSTLSSRTLKPAASSPSPTPRGGNPPGSTLLVGIPCVVATTADGKPCKFRAVVKYLGEAFFDAGQWVGVEVAEKDDLPDKSWNDGSVDGVRYFELGQESKESRLRLSRVLTATPSGDHSTAPSEESSVNSLRPSFTSRNSRKSEASEAASEMVPTRGLFVRPAEVIFVF